MNTRITYSTAFALVFVGVAGGAVLIVQSQTPPRAVSYAPPHVVRPMRSVVPSPVKVALRGVAPAAALNPTIAPPPVAPAALKPAPAPSVAPAATKPELAPPPLAQVPASPVAQSAPTSVPVAPMGKSDLLRIHPNEGGMIPILMYHSIGDPKYFSTSRYDKRGLNIAPETFRNQLNLMYKAGWYPVNMRDILSAHLNVPKGKTPVVLTFDDSRASQFRYRADGTIDPNCAVGLINAFHAKHPDWQTRATFYVLPKSHWNPLPFQQDKLDTKKLRYLVEHGFEVANHSTSHRSMGPMSAETIRWEMAECTRYVRQRAPKATMDTMALPYGIAPHNKSFWVRLLDDGSKTSAYQNRCVLLAAGNASYAPWDTRFNALRVQRIGSEPNEIERWIKMLKPGSKRWQPYISDGDPNVLTVPRSGAGHLNKKRLGAMPLFVYEDRKPIPKKPVTTLSAAQKTGTPTEPPVAQSPKFITVAGR